MLHKIINRHEDIAHDQILHTAPSNTWSNSRNFYTCHQGFIPSNIHFFRLQSDYHLPDHLVEIVNVDTFQSLL